MKFSTENVIVKSQFYWKQSHRLLNSFNITKRLERKQTIERVMGSQCPNEMAVTMRHDLNEI